MRRRVRTTTSALLALAMLLAAQATPTPARAADGDRVRHDLETQLRFQIPALGYTDGTVRLAELTLSFLFVERVIGEAGAGFAIYQGAGPALQGFVRTGVSFNLLDSRTRGYSGWVLRVPLLVGYRSAQGVYKPTGEWCEKTTDYASALTAHVGLEAAYFGRSRAFTMRLLGGGAVGLSGHAPFRDCVPEPMKPLDVGAQIGVVF